MCPPARQLELPHPAPHRRGPPRRRGGALRGSAARRARWRRSPTLRGRARLVHGALRAPSEDDAPIHGVLPGDLRSLRAHRLHAFGLLRCLRALPMDAAREGRREREGWRDRRRRTSKDRLGAGPGARDPQSPWQGGGDSLDPGAGEPARAARHLLRGSPAGRVALLLLCQANSALRAVPARDRRRGPRAFLGRGHRVRIQGQEPAAPLRALGAQRGPLGPARLRGRLPLSLPGGAGPRRGRGGRPRGVRGLRS